MHDARFRTLSLSRALPAPIKSYEVFSDTADRQAAAARPPKVLPPYGRRQGFVPRSQEDFGGGGAYPEVHVAQFPLDMGRPGRAASTGTSTALVPLSVDSQTGQARFDAIITAQHRGKNVHTQFGALVEKRPEDVVRMRPSAEEEAAVAARTNAALSGIVAHTLTNARTSTVDPNAKSRSDEAKFIRYTPSTDTPGFSEATKQRVIRLVEAPVDPLEPPKFKHKKVPGGPPDAPVPVMHSPPRKVTAEDQEAWRIPSAMSNWKNPHGYVIPLDKRLAADGRSLLEPVINDNFAKLSEALLIAERKARVEVETRAAIQKKLAVKESEAKEAELRALAAKARAERAGIANLAEGGGAPPTAAAAAGLVDFEGAGSSASASAGRAPAAGGVGASRGAGGGGVGVGGDLLGGSYDSDGEDGGGRQQAAPGFITGGRGAAEAAEDYEAAKERDQLRAERKRERERELRTEAGGKRSRVARDDERDVSERIALGMPVGTGAAGGGGAEALYDSRLFNQAEGMQSGFTAEDGEWARARVGRALRQVLRGVVACLPGLVGGLPATLEPSRRTPPPENARSHMRSSPHACTLPPLPPSQSTRSTLRPGAPRPPPAAARRARTAPARAWAPAARAAAAPAPRSSCASCRTPQSSAGAAAGRTSKESPRGHAGRAARCSSRRRQRAPLAPPRPPRTPSGSTSSSPPSPARAARAAATRCRASARAGSWLRPAAAWRARQRSTPAAAGGTRSRSGRAAPPGSVFETRRACI